MHPRNPYINPPDFASLADAYPALKTQLMRLANNIFTIDFKNELSQRCLTEALLHRDFNLTIAVPDDRLCPPVPNRLNYILWLQDILSATALITSDSEAQNLLGIDIGTGSSAIYPLLGCQSDQRWAFIATDVDEKSLDFARRNVQTNLLDSRISVVKSDPTGPILLRVLQDDTLLPQGVDSFSFTMCNPPFYSSREEILRSAEAKEFEPTAVCTGADVEMITPGGESAFVCRIVRESLEARTRCRWYTSMLGKMSSLSEVVTLLRESRIDNYACTEFVQGQTRRWAVAWSFDDVRLPDSLARTHSPALQSIMPPRNTRHKAN
ncbi:S-adenosyl-L-methionine dependent methyltransferase [Wolfiporia cocos MD-104 SS10]|uniref:S-adenosyl-L-methionine dependent methyltransferase n=1 Tax=Wolfiporia cocos (strain MD-104) TaxID=742152 RepID=A0A2H3JP67_WOLCO|nr:S-adenosyl-L-methionine dependent methyltransferase [Wolfiporia cocos MD-104 SS10]